MLNTNLLDRRRAIATLVGGFSLGPLGWLDLGDPRQRAFGQDQPPVVPTAARAATARGSKNAVATVHPLATQAGMNALARGGNAFDAAVAAAIMLGVVDGHNSGIGGGCFVLGRTAAGDLIAIDGRETAPGRAHRDMYVRDGKLDPMASQIGPLASGVPGQVAALAKLSLSCGRGGWSSSLSEAADVAERGYLIGEATASAIRRKASSLARFPAAAKQFLKGNGASPVVRDRLRQPDLGRTLSALAREGPDWFYRGPFAEACASWMAGNGGLLDRADFAGYVAKSREPLVTRYRGHQIVGFPPPSSGGMHIAQMLIMLERFPIGRWLSEEPATAIHVLAEVMKRAFADRAHWLGDADFAAVPRGLVDPEYCRQLSAEIDIRQAREVRSHGMPPRATDDLFNRRHTTHLTAVDAEGNWVAITNTVNTTFGSCVVIPETGVVMNNQMDDFSIAPGTPNAFGLIGAEANSVEPGKRPLSSMSPTIVLNSDRTPRLTCGAAGGPRIISATLQCILRVLDQGLSVDEALAAPRVHHQWSPDQLMPEGDWAAEVLRDVESRGHKMATAGNIGIAQAIERTPEGNLVAATDPRTEGSAAAD